MDSAWSFDVAYSAMTWSVIGIFLLAGFVKGVVGMGLPTVAMGLLGLMMPPAQAAALLIVPSLVTNVWQLLAGGHFVWLLRRLWSMLLGIVVGTLLGVYFWATDVSEFATGALGAILVLYALAGLLKIRFLVSGRQENHLSPLIGVITGVVTAVTGVFVLPAVPYLQALNLERDALIQALGLSFTTSTIALAIGLVHGGVFYTNTAIASVGALLPALAGMLIGQFLRTKIAAPVFQRCFFIALLLLGLHLTMRLM